jgi:hypothetical protein
VVGACRNDIYEGVTVEWGGIREAQAVELGGDVWQPWRGEGSEEMGMIR